MRTLHEFSLLSGSTRTMLEMPRVPLGPPVHFREETNHSSLRQVRLKAKKNRAVPPTQVRSVPC